MVEIEDSPLAVAFVAVVAVAGIVALAAWLWRWASQGYVLAYVPRPPVPWRLGAGIPAVLLTLLGIAVAIGAPAGAGDDAPSEISAEQFAADVFSTSAMHLGLAAAIVVLLIVALGASPRDLGWPSSARQLMDDLGLGAWITLASLVPIYVLQVAARLLLDMTPTHPLLDKIESDPSPLVFAAAMLAAAVVAPVFEELLFRLLLQGGLERWEDDRLMPPDLPAGTSENLSATDPESEVHSSDSDETMPLAGRPQAATDQNAIESPALVQHPPTPPRTAGAVAGLPHGWAPILASSFIFALAHLGNGPSPIALFVFAIFLGYAYQRTHRIVPCIVAHMTLNLISVTVMFLGVSGN